MTSRASKAPQLLGQLLLQQAIQAPGRWQVAIAGGTRELRIDEIAGADR